LLGWIGECVVLLVYGMIDSDLGRLGAVAIWLMATGGPIQPAAAVLGAWLVRRERARS
jgi:hypothetical protein